MSVFEHRSHEAVNASSFRCANIMQKIDASLHNFSKLELHYLNPIRENTSKKKRGKRRQTSIPCWYLLLWRRSPSDLRAVIANHNSRASMECTGKQVGGPPFLQRHMPGGQGTVRRPGGNSRPATLRKASQTCINSNHPQKRKRKTHIGFQPRFQPFLRQLAHTFQTGTYDGGCPTFHTFHHRRFCFAQRDHQF